jgi:hypothetical protein
MEENNKQNFQSMSDCCEAYCVSINGTIKVHNNNGIKTKNINSGTNNAFRPTPPY